MQCLTGEPPGWYIEQNILLSKKEKEERLDDWENELLDEDCTYRKVLEPAELAFLKGLLAFFPNHRFHLEDLLSNSPRVAPPEALYMWEGPLAALPEFLLRDLCYLKDETSIQ